MLAFLRLTNKLIFTKNTFACEANCCICRISSMNMSDKSVDGSVAINLLVPPAEVKGMKTLDRDAFKKKVKVPTLHIPVEKLKEAVKSLKPCFLKMPNILPVQGEGKEKRILLHPHLFDESIPYLQKIIRKLSLENATQIELELTYDNWSPGTIFKAVLPPDTMGNVSGYSIVGHIIHLNLKPDLMDYKYLIGQVLLDKFSNIKTVVNKAQIIENEFRNLNIELLAGEPNYQVLVKESNCRYVFDFSKVFWNPRLVHEHSQIVKLADHGDLVYDVFAGVGPFAVPLAKKKCQVHANDLNPDSYHWLCHNASLNKVTQYLHSYNMDGKVFIQSVLKKGIVEHWSTDENDCNIHILMNLPACALEFLEAFKGLLAGQNINKIGKMPIVYCYFFLKKDEELQDVTGKYLDSETQKNAEFTSVRLVAPNKSMMRMIYTIPRSTLFFEESSEPQAKKLKLNEEVVKEIAKV